jgi:hypothetical protein
MRSAFLRWILRILSAALVLWGTTATSQLTPVLLYSGNVGLFVWDTDSTRVALSMQIVNGGRSPAQDVRVNAVNVTAGNYLGPATLPITLGVIDPGHDAIMDLLVRVPASNGTRYVLTISGTYRNAGQLYGYSINRAISPAPPPTTFPVTTGTAVVQNPNAIAYPPSPPKIAFGPNAETPMLIPIGPPRQVFPPTPTSTSIGPPSGGTSPGGASVQIPVNTPMTGSNGLIPPDPNAAAQGGTNGVVLATYNASRSGTPGGISYSTNGGATFTDVNLSDPQPGNPARTSFFPQSDGGLCCDQVVVYLPQQNLFVWLLQYNPVVACATNCLPAPGPTSTYNITQASRLRIAWATPAAIAADFWNAWRYADQTGTNVAGVSSGLGIANNEWLDYPDLAWSNTFLYVGIDHGFPTPGQVYTGRRIVARLSLADIANPGAGVVNYAWTELTGSSGLNKTHFVQGAPGRMVVGSLDSSSRLRIFTWLDSSNTLAAPSTVNITQITQGASYTSVAPDGIDWLAVSFPGNITGGAYVFVPANPGGGIFGPPTPERNLYTFAFDAGQNGPGRPRAFVRLQTVSATATGYDAFAEYDIWHPDYAYAMAALGSSDQEMGITLAVGGGTLGYPQEAVGFRNDFVVYQITNSNATQVSRFGDYFSNRLVPSNTVRFGTEVYDVRLNAVPPGGTATCAAVGCAANMRYVEYQRPPFVGPR